MDNSQADNAIEIKSMLSNGGLPSSWISNSQYDLTNAAPLVTLLTLLIPLSLYYMHKHYQKMQDKNRKPFAFTALPRELRDMIYTHLLEDPIYPLPPTSPSSSSSYWIIPGRWTAPILRPQPRVPKKGNWVLLANKQLHEEFMDLVCKRRTLHLTVSPHNYQKPCTSSDGKPEAEKPIWTIAPSTLQNTRTCNLQLVTTSSMLGVSDPRNMKSDDWALARQVRRELRHMSNVTSFALDAKAIGDPLWNPLWIWYHASQSFKDMGTASSLSSSLSSTSSAPPPSSSSSSTGPKLHKITFSLDTWSPGENHLERDAKGCWVWYCLAGHAVGADGGADMTVREFCARLYQECVVCRPVLEGEEE
ncbi:hypothetical protein P153DRAFT_370784 [Dothidotthia symphoricarpi CBS 119687]|uniref:Uncharacterized protein n=1 Tax=Dothidotthia symphoricarpi CBS 119687 TaxID=1392245 RepID=A0A6A5ZZ93_9PLEO|nr:uncharacterized protein P153DRAFT_370784 [Dothidotthia symphoricarpi CBS 119687]KAF2124890.1 hypothetical protein P153DRAFT_370784 [Dothidotthia symphoricarpi CBS 119687]